MDERKNRINSIMIRWTALPVPHFSIIILKKKLNRQVKNP
jgi:hypothetical protein